MSPAPRDTRRDELALNVLRARRLRAQRRKRISRRRRRIGIFAGILGLLIAASLLTVGFGGAIAYQKGCTLSSLEPFSIGQNTFIYAADGSRLGAIPSEGRNR